jgi:hypothetical protein
MERKTDDIQRYVAELDEIARLDRRFYLNSAPTRSDRASYALRQEHLSEIRNRFSAESILLQDQRNIEMETFQAETTHPESGIISLRQCMLAHDLNHGLTVVIGRCDLLSKLVPEDETMQRHLSGIREEAMKMASSIGGLVCQNRR